MSDDSYTSMISESIDELNASKDFTGTEIDDKKPERKKTQSSLKHPWMFSLACTAILSSISYYYLSSLDGRAISREQMTQALHAHIEEAFADTAQITKIFVDSTLSSDKTALEVKNTLLKNLQKVNAPQELSREISKMDDIPEQGLR